MAGRPSALGAHFMRICNWRHPKRLHSKVGYATVSNIEPGNMAAGIYCSSNSFMAGNGFFKNYLKKMAIRMRMMKKPDGATNKNL